MIGSPAISSVKSTDEIFTNVLIQPGKKPRKKGVSEPLFHYVEEREGRVIKACEEILIATTDGEQNPKSILVTGKAGIGKSLFCQKLIRNWADDQLFMKRSNEPLPDFKFVYLLIFRQLSFLGRNCATLKQILNLSSILDDQSNIDDSLFEYILHHPEEVLIIMDGYNEYSQQDYVPDDSELQYPNSATEEMPVAVLCSKLMKGKILRDSVVIITSRPKESEKISGIDFDRYVEISGFSAQQVKEYIGKYFRENETIKNNVLDHVMNNESLVSFAHVPVLCFVMCRYMEYTLTVSKSNNDLPVSVIDLYSGALKMFELEQNNGLELPMKLDESYFVDNLSELVMLTWKSDLFQMKQRSLSSNSLWSF